MIFQIANRLDLDFPFNNVTYNVGSHVYLKDLEKTKTHNNVSPNYAISLSLNYF